MARLIVDVTEDQKEAIEKAAEKRDQTIKFVVLDSLQKNKVDVLNSSDLKSQKKAIK